MIAAIHWAGIKLDVLVRELLNFGYTDLASQVANFGSTADVMELDLWSPGEEDVMRRALRRITDRMKEG